MIKINDLAHQLCAQQDAVHASRFIGCAMTKGDKKAHKRLGKGRCQRAFVAALVALQAEFGGFAHWSGAYRRKCAKKDKPCLLDDPEVRADAA